MRRRRHRLFLIIQLLILALVSGSVLWHIIRVAPEERMEYRQLMQPSHLTGVPEEYQSRQYRKDICRDIYVGDLQTRLIAAQGTLVFVQDEQEPGFVEELKQVECWMQEEITESVGAPVQVVRHIMAEKACFDYRTNTLTTEAISFERYTLPGKKLDYQAGIPVLTGQATSAVVTFKEGKPGFEAKRLKIKLPGKIT